MTPDAFTVREVPSAEVPAVVRDALVRLCDAAYDEPTAPAFADVGPGLHLIGRVGERIVSHLLLVDRQLETGDGSSLHTAYVELVATHPDLQGRGYASALLREVPRLAARHDLAALSPSDEGFYARLGWVPWRGALGVRMDGGVSWLEDESVMILRTPRTPASLDVHQSLTCEWRPGEAW